MMQGYRYGAPMDLARQIEVPERALTEPLLPTAESVREACAEIGSFFARLAKAERERDEALAKLAAVRAALGET